MDWSKEMWFALLFITVGFTIWPLLVYYIGLALGVGFFLETTLRVWAETDRLWSTWRSRFLFF